MDPIRSWWQWSTESFGHMFVGVTAPILLLAAMFIIFVTGNGGSDSSPQPPQADVAGVCVTAGPGPASAGCPEDVRTDQVLIETATVVPPTPTPQPRTYSVQSGDTLSQICASQAPDLALAGCVASIVGLNGLDGTEQIFAGQSLELPAGAVPVSTGQRQPAPTQAAEALEATPVVESVPAPEPTAEPEPRASLVEIGPGAVATASASEPTPEAAGGDGPETPLEDVDTSALEGGEYVVESGDSLLGICVTEVPDMDADDCIEFTTLLNGLDGPDEIQLGQVLFLP